MSAIRRLLRQAEYLISVHNRSQLPPDQGREVAIAGRSNAGKSSLINRLCHRKALARTSRTPGRTRQLVFFRLDDHRHLVDLPGYGFARVGGDLKRHWKGLIQGYLEKRQALAGLVIVMDVRHPLKDSDIELANWAGSRGLPLHLVLTKADKLGRGKQSEALLGVRKLVDANVGVQLFSATSGQGIDELETVMADWFLGSADDQSAGRSESPGQ
ncbi:ribosome biogenesis GTP-binding protein YihA/YsxC [Wenzhouxiangella sp. AB-CW3]|uniref:ribosome biogenesis GTP-binding protein YihA/YsxC n=1 Tax=Wenzhouxiangella sp. AB-CW3 TaxID=2771012 RepID=UPI001CC29C92|nr:ribosome biogenesis GTP-binding protein YihA/YsxC [Wenzhouxiangella sp. AB-CW3]